MPAPYFNDQIQPGIDVLSTEVSDQTKRILARTGDNNGGGSSHGDDVEWWQHVGFASRPANPAPGEAAAQALVMRQSANDIAFASQDARGLEIYGNLQPGETCVFATGADGKAQARALFKADGSINLFTKEGNAADGKGMGIFLNPDGSISIASHNGAAVLLGTDGSLKLFNGSGGVQVTSDGAVKIASGSKIDISGATITLGGPTSLPLAVAPQVVAAITALQVQVAAQAAAWAALGALSGPILGVMVQPIAAPLAGITAAGTAAVSSANALIPTKRVSGD